MAAEMSEKVRLIITVAVVSLANAGIWGFVYKLHQDFKKKEAERMKLQTTVEQLKAEAETKGDKQIELETLRRENERQLKKLPDEKDVERFIQELANIAGKSDVKIDGVVRPKKGAPPEIPGLGANFKKDIYIARYQASFRGFCEFANYLEEFHKWFVGLENVTIQAKAGGLAITGAKHNMSFNVVTYRYVRTP